MLDDPLLRPLREGRQLTVEDLVLAMRHRLARIDEIWSEVRILEKLIGSPPGAYSIAIERDPPIEATECSHH